MPSRSAARHANDLEHDDDECYSDEENDDNPPHSRTGSEDPYLDRTTAFRAFLESRPPEEIAQRVRLAIKFMATELKLDLTLLLEYVCWGLTGNNDRQYNSLCTYRTYAKSSFTRNSSQDAPSPRSHARGVRTKAALPEMEAWALDLVKRKVNKEMRDLAPIMRSPPADFSEETLLAIKLGDIVCQTRKAAPTLWDFLRSASYTPKQEKRNTYKAPDTVSYSAYIMRILYLSLLIS